MSLMSRWPSKTAGWAQVGQVPIEDGGVAPRDCGQFCAVAMVARQHNSAINRSAFINNIKGK